MKLVLIAACIISLAFIACNSQHNRQKEKVGDTAVDSALKDRILGIWAFAGDENATFVIKKDKITYPDHNTSYRYVLSNDSIHIKFDGYVGNYLVQTRGPDTLVLGGDDQQVYYRFSK